MLTVARAWSAARPFSALRPLVRLSHGATHGVRKPTAAAAPAIKVDDFIVTSPHARLVTDDYMLPHAVYTKEEVEALRVDIHFPHDKLKDKVALGAITVIRRSFDFLSGYTHVPGAMTEDKYLIRAIFLETIAAVPGMVASMVRHFESLRLMRRDGAWIGTLLQEAENERMHLMTFLTLKQPGIAMRAAVLASQGVFFNAFFLSYLFAPSFCHRVVGYLEEEAVRTYTRMISDIDSGFLPGWSTMPAPPIAVAYWRLPADAKLRDVLLAIRADEAIHRDVNHVFGSLKKDERSPFHT